MMLGTSVQQTGLCNFTVTVCLKFSSHTFSCLEYINDNKAILEKNLSSMALAERQQELKSGQEEYAGNLVMIMMFQRKETVYCQCARWIDNGFQLRVVKVYVRKTTLNLVPRSKVHKDSTLYTMTRARFE